MDKTRKPTLFLLVLLTALAVPPIEKLWERQGLVWAQEATPAPTPTFTPLDSLEAGTQIHISGAPDMEAITRSIDQEFEQRYPGSEVEFEASNSDAAIQALLNGDVDLAAIARPLTDAEMEQNLTEIVISREKIALIVGSENPFQGDIPADAFVKIFRGEITNWSELGGPDLPIRFIDRPVDSDIRKAFSGYDLFAGAPFENGPNTVRVEEDSTAAVVRALGNDGIGYAIADQVANQDSVRVLTMFGTSPTDDLYPYSQPRSYVYQGEPSIPVEAYLGYATSPDGQQAVAQAKAVESAEVATADLLPGEVALSPDGQLMVQGNADGTLQWLDAQGKPLGIASKGHEGMITGVAIAPDGQTIVSTGADGKLRLWDVEGNTKGEPIQGSDGPITALTLSSDGQTIVTGNNDGTLQRWGIDGQPLGEPIKAHDGAIRTLTFGPEGQVLVSGSNDATVSFWTPEGAPIEKLANAHKGGVTAIAITPDNQTIITGGADGTLRFWDPAGVPIGEPIAAHNAPITAITVSDDNQTIATAAKDNTLKLWDRSGQPKGEGTKELPEPASSLKYGPDGNLIAGLPNGNVQIRDPQGEPIGGSLPNLSEPPITPPAGFTQWFEDRGIPLPKSTWWIIPVLPILLILAGTIWTLMGGKSRTDEEEDSLATDDAGVDTDFAVDSNEVDSSLVTTTDGWDATDFNDSGTGTTDFTATDFSTDGDADFVTSGSFDESESLPDAGSGVDKLAKARSDLAEGKRLAREGLYNDALNFFNSSIEAAEVERFKATAAGASLGGVAAVLAQAMAGRGSVMSVLGRPDASLVSLNRALEIDSSCIDAWIGKGQLLASTGQVEEALFCFDKALELDPNSAVALAGKGRTLIQMGRQTEGQEYLQRAEALGGEPVPPPPTPLVAPVPANPSPVTVEGNGGAGVGVIPTPITPISSAEEIGTAGLDPSFEGKVADPDVPEELQQALEVLPNEGAIIQLPNPTITEPDVPPEVSSLSETLPEQPETIDHSQGNGSGTGTAQLPLAETLPETATLPNPGELDEMIEALQTAGDPTVGETVAATNPVVEADSPVPPDNSRGMTIEPGEPVDLDTASDISDLPPDVLAALASIPADSPDSFELPATETASAPAPVNPNVPPPPPPANPRLATPPSVATQSWINLSTPEADDRLYAVWEIDRDERQAVKQRGGETLHLRLYDVTDLPPGSQSEPPLMEDQECYELATDWYLALPMPNRIYQAAIGYVGGEGQWLELAKSAPLEVGAGG